MFDGYSIWKLAEQYRAERVKESEIDRLVKEARADRPSNLKLALALLLSSAVLVALLIARLG